MDDLQALQKIQKLLKADLESVSTVLISGGVDKIDNYKYLVGQAFTIKRTFRKSLTCYNLRSKKMSKEQLSTSDKQEPNQVPKIKLALQEKY
jgi:hypothetical protein